ncbi:MAG TPA: serine hydrolase domain-containing protein [Phnomibacter sp.]|nr:serine hydrolase domain-containing protein [Phnomibacter sp.]
MRCLLFILMCMGMQSIAQPTLQPGAPATAGMNAARLNRIDALVQQYIDSQWIAGGTAIIARNGVIVYHKAFGVSNMDTKTPEKVDDIFRIASQTKAITSVAVMILFEEGKLLLDDPIGKYIPAFEGQQVIDTFNEKDTTYTMVKAKRAVTIRDLLTHTSGIGYAQIGTVRAKAMYAKAGVHSQIGNPSESLQEQVLKIAALPLEYQPGERFSYGLNSDVLGYLVEVISHQSLADFFRTRIFEPLGMKDTWFYLPKEKQSRLVALHTEDSRKKIIVMKKAPGNMSNLVIDYPNAAGRMYSGGAGLSSTALDYAIFLQMMLNGGIYNGKRILSKNSVDMMTQNQIGNVDRGPYEKFGLGFGIVTENGTARIGQSEGTFSWGGAFSSNYFADPKEKLVVQFFLNQTPNSHWDILDKFKVLVYSAIEK